MLVFHNGKVVCSGAKNKEEARRAISWLASELVRRNLIFPDGQEIEAAEVPKAQAHIRIWGRSRTLTIALPDEYVEGLEELVRQGYYPSINEAVMVAIRDLLATRRGVSMP